MNKRGISLVAQWLRLCLPMQGVWVQSLVGELRFRMLRGMDKTNKQKPKTKKTQKAIHSHQEFRSITVPPPTRLWHSPFLFSPPNFSPTLVFILGINTNSSFCTAVCSLCCPIAQICPPKWCMELLQTNPVADLRRCLMIWFFSPCYKAQCLHHCTEEPTKGLRSKSRGVCLGL